MGVFYHCPTSFATMLIKCYATEEIFFSENLFDTDRAVRATSECPFGSPRCATLCHIVDSVNPSATVSLYGSMSVCPCRRRRLVKVGLGRVKLRRRLVDFGNVLCYYIVRVYQDLPTRTTKPKPPMGFAPRAQDPLPILTKSHCGSHPATVYLYQTLPPDPTKPNTPMVLHVSTPTNPYHTTA